MALIALLWTCASTCTALELPRRPLLLGPAALTALLWLCACSSALELPRRPLLLGPAAATAASKVNANELPSPLVRILTNPSFVDSRDYRYVTTPSGLRIVVAGDPDARDATLALTVGAGQLREPFEGLSHLTEHLTMAASNLEQKAID